MRPLAAAILVALAVVSPALAADGGIGVRVALTPRSQLFGDKVAAEVDVVLASRAAGSVAIHPDFSPYAPLAPPRVSRTDGGGSTEIRYRYVLDRLEPACLPGDTRRRVVFSPVHVSVRVAGRVADAAAAWPALTVRSRLAPEDVTRGRPRSSIYPVGPVTYRISPQLLFWALTGAAGGLALVAVGLLGSLLLGVRIHWRRDRFGRLGPLERALVLVRMAARGGDVSHRRRALERLGHELEARGRRELGAEACSLAWAPAAPEADAVLALAGRVEQEVAR